MKVHFVQDNSFLRTPQKTNPFFDPIIKVCEENGIEWKVWFPARPKACGYETGHIEYYRFFNALGIWFWRVAHIFWHAPVWRIYETFGRISRVLFGKTFKADLYVTIAGNLARQLQGMFPNARVIDIQHGVIYSKHNGYFEKDGRLIEPYRKPSRREFWLYGQGYADCFFKNPKNRKDLEGRVRIIGDVIRGNAAGKQMQVANDCGERNLVVMSLQLTRDLDEEESRSSVKQMEIFFARFFEQYGNKYEVLLKHHPRYNDCFDLSDFYRKFPNVQESHDAWTDLFPRMVLHVTFTSTMVFDCAAVGIPSVLLDLPRAKIINRRYYHDDYDYPYYFATVDELLSGGDQVRARVLEWYRCFYTPFDTQECLELLMSTSGSRR